MGRAGRELLGKEKRVFKHQRKRSIYMREENIANTTLRGSGASGKASNLPTPNS